MSLLYDIGAHGAALIALLSVPAPLPPPPYSHSVQVESVLLGSVLFAAQERCSNAFGDSAGRYVEAFGTPRGSPEWKLAASKMLDMLTICHERSKAARAQKDFLEKVVQSGSQRDSDIAAKSLDGTVYQLNFFEKQIAEETVRYRKLITAGWGDPPCVDKSDGIMSNWKLCSSGNRGKPPLP